MDQLYDTLEGICLNAVPERHLADAGHNNKHNHEMLREYLLVDSLIPAKAGRPTDKPPTGKHRRQMATDIDHDTYGPRWQVETVMFMLKNHLGDAVVSRSPAAWRDEPGIKTVTHNVMIVYG